MEIVDFKPIDAKRIRIIGSPFQDSNCEIVLANILLTIQELSPEEWVPFTKDDYCKSVSHSPSNEELRYLDRFIVGGRVQDKFIQGGWLTKVGDEYSLTGKTIKLVFSYQKDLHE